MDKSNKVRNRSLIIGTVIYAIGNFGTKILSFLIVPIYTFYISPEELGEYDLLMTTVSLLSPLITMKISDATYRCIIRKEDKTENCLSATYQVLVVNSFLCVIILLLINHFFPIWNCYYFIIILVLDRVLECLQKLLRGLKKQKLFVISGLIYTIVLVSLNLIKICIFREGVNALLESVVMSQIITILLILLLEKKLLKVNLKKNYVKLQKDLLKYSIPLVPSALGWWVMSASDRYIIRYFLGSAANGIFAVAYKFPSILQTFFVMFNNSWTDLALTELEKGNNTEEYTANVFKGLYKTSFAITLILIPVTKVLTQLVLSNSYKEAASYIGFLYLGTVFQGFSSFCSIGYLHGKKTNGAAITSIYGAIVNLVLNLLLIKSCGLFAAAISTFAGFFVMWLVRMYNIRNMFPVKVNYKLFSSYLVACIIMAIISLNSTLVIDVLFTLLTSIFFIISNKKMILNLVKNIQIKLINAF